MSKITPLAAQNSLQSAHHRFKESAATVKAAHVSARKEILDDPRRSELAKQQDLEALDTATRAKLDAIKGEQEAFDKGLREQIEREMRSGQPADANSVLLRRDASDRVRKITDKQEALEVLNDAIANGDDSLAHAIGTRARNTSMFEVAEAYQAAYPSTAESAEALAYVEANTSGGAYNLANQITYAAPNV